MKVEENKSSRGDGWAVSQAYLCMLTHSHERQQDRTHLQTKIDANKREKVKGATKQLQETPLQKPEKLKPERVKSNWYHIPSLTSGPRLSLLANPDVVV